MNLKPSLLLMAAVSQRFQLIFMNQNTLQAWRQYNIQSLQTMQIYLHVHKSDCRWRFEVSFNADDSFAQPALLLGEECKIAKQLTAGCSIRPGHLHQNEEKYRKPFCRVHTFDHVCNVTIHLQTGWAFIAIAQCWFYPFTLWVSSDITATIFQYHHPYRQTIVKCKLLGEQMFAASSRVLNLNCIHFRHLYH